MAGQQRTSENGNKYTRGENQTLRRHCKCRSALSKLLNPVQQNALTDDIRYFIPKASLSSMDVLTASALHDTRPFEGAHSSGK